MKKILVFVLAASFLLGACGTEKGIEINQAWARPAAQGENGAIYFVIRNQGRGADELTGVSSEAAEAAEIHESKMDGDVMQMHQLEAVPLEAGTQVTFEPGGRHIMLIDLKKDLKTGDEIDVTLHFRNFEDIHLRVSVREKERE